VQEKGNLTLRVDEMTLRRARVLAAEKGTSVTRLLGDYVARVVGDEEAYQAARRRAEALLDAGFHLGGKIRATREELHDREGLRRHQQDLQDGLRLEGLVVRNPFR
jgi:hypothetical protein